MGLGAIAAAAKMGEVDPLTMATWAPGEPVPFSFLADTFEVRRSQCVSTVQQCNVEVRCSSSTYLS